MKRLIIISLLLIGARGFAQDTFFQEGNPTTESQAAEITNEYIPHLGMTGEQQVLFQKKVEEFLLRRQKIEKEYTGKQKLDYLTTLQLEETDEMHNILTRPQMEVYKKIKPTIQPLEVIEVKKE